MEVQLENYLARKIRSEDAPLFFQLIENNRPRLEDYFSGTVDKTQSLEATTAYCKTIEQLIADKSYFPYLLINTSKQEVIGLIDFKNIDWSIPKAEMGAFIDSNYEGLGIISQLGDALIKLVVKEFQLKKIYCRAAAENKRSIKTILRNGFELEGTIRRDYKTTDGRIVDLNYYGKLY